TCSQAASSARVGFRLAAIASAASLPSGRRRGVGSALGAVVVAAAALAGAPGGLWSRAAWLGGGGAVVWGWARGRGGWFGGAGVGAVQPGAERAGLDDQHLDPERGNLGGGGLRQAFESELGRRVGADTGEGYAAAHAGDLHDGARALPAHVR